MAYIDGHDASESQRRDDSSKNFGSKIESDVERFASTAGKKAEEIGRRASDKADGALASVGNQMNSFADTMKENVDRDGSIGSAVSAVADTLHDGGDYLVQHSIKDITDDLTSVVKKYPMYSLWFGVGIGVLAATALSKR